MSLTARRRFMMDWRFASYDISDDAGGMLRHCFPNSDTLPPFVKTAQVPAAGPADQWAVAYDDATVSLRKFAMTDRAHTWLSSVYFTRTSHSLPPEMRKLAAQRLLRACEQYDLEPNETLCKLAWGEDARIPIPAHLEKAASDLAAAREAAAARNTTVSRDPSMLDSASRHQFYKQAHPNSYGQVDQESLYRGLSQRLLYLPESERPEVFTSFEKMASQDGDSMVTFLRNFDIERGLITKWGSSLADPEETVFGTPRAEPAAPKKAPAPVLHAGKVLITADDLECLLKSQLFRSQFPPDFVAQMSESPVEVFKSLPKTTQEELASLAQRCK